MAQGSHKSWGHLSSRVCCICGQKLTLNDTAVQHTAYRDGRPVSWSHHVACSPHVPLEQAMEAA